MGLVCFDAGEGEGEILVFLDLSSYFFDGDVTRMVVV